MAELTDEQLYRYDEMLASIRERGAISPDARAALAAAEELLTAAKQLHAELATVRTGKSLMGDGINRRDWTRQQWLDEARECFHGAFGSAGDLLNGHVSAMWAELAKVTGERDDALLTLQALLIGAPSTSDNGSGS